MFVEIGLDNNRMVRIIRGLEPGEIVLLTPPLESAAVETSTNKISSERISISNEESPDSEPTGGIKEETQKGSSMTDLPVERNPGPEQRRKSREEFEKFAPEGQDKLQRQMRDKR